MIIYSHYFTIQMEVKAITALNKTLSGGHTTDGFSNV